MLTQQHVALEKEIEEAFEHKLGWCWKNAGCERGFNIREQFSVGAENSDFFLFASCVFPLAGNLTEQAGSV